MGANISKKLPLLQFEAYAEKLLQAAGGGFINTFVAFDLLGFIFEKLKVRSRMWHIYLLKSIFIQGELVSNKVLFCPSALLNSTIYKYGKNTRIQKKMV